MQNLIEKFDSPVGALVEYDTFDTTVTEVINRQRHIDIRTFNEKGILAGSNVRRLSNRTVGELSTSIVSNLDNLIAVVPPESWTGDDPITYGIRAIGGETGMTISASGSATVSSMGTPIDLSVLPEGLLSVAFYQLPASSINLANSYIDISSDPSGGFADEVTQTFALNQSNTTLPTGVTNWEFRVGLDFSRPEVTSVMGIRFRFTMLSNATIYIRAIRLLDPDWVYTGYDVDTAYNHLRRAVPRDGAIPGPAAIQWPILFDSSTLPGGSDPRPINGEVAAVFNTGTQTQANEITLYFREIAEDFMQQIDLDLLQMSELNGRIMPDVGIAKFATRRVEDLQGRPQSELQGAHQIDLSRVPDYTSRSWISFSCQWRFDQASISIGNSEGEGYQFTFAEALDPNRNYIMLADLEDDTARFRLYPLRDDTLIDTDNMVFDSTEIEDSFIYKRRKGRFGWYTRLSDNDAYIQNIAWRRVVFNEYRSVPFNHITPVTGAQLFADATAPVELVTGVVPTSSAVSLVPDQSRSLSGESYRISDKGTNELQGIATDYFEVTDFDQIEIRFAIFYEGRGGIDIYLENRIGTLTILPQPLIGRGQWQNVKLRTPVRNRLPSGEYRLTLVQTTREEGRWWIDNLSVSERQVSWYARATSGDPWEGDSVLWMPFESTINSATGGLLFPEYSRQMQIRGLAHRQYATIDKVQTKPIYARPGRFVWDEDEPDYILKQQGTTLLPPNAGFSSSSVGRTFTFVSTSVDPNTFTNGKVSGIIGWYWTTSDGAVYSGPSITHTFPVPANYSVVLTVMNRYGLTATATATISAF